MAFENISKGESEIIVNAVFKKQSDHCIHVSNFFDNNEKDNVEFVAYCFNLQQKYDISKFEECVKLLEGFYECSGLRIDDKFAIEQLLKEVKK